MNLNLVNVFKATVRRPVMQRITSSFLLLAGLVPNTEAQTISTIAGNGAQGFIGDGGAATLAEISGPNGICTDGAGNVYFADALNHRIRMVDKAGVISTFAGKGNLGFSGDGGAATLAELNYPQSIAIDKGGNIYIGDYGNARIRKVSVTGIISTIAGNGIAGYGGDGGPATAAEINGPAGIAIDGKGDIYIADFGNHRIRMVNGSGIMTTVAGNGTAGYTGDGGSAASAELNYPSALDVDASGNLFIADYQNYRVRKVNSAGLITTIAGTGTAGFSGDGGSALTALIDTPTGIAIDSSGNVYIADWNNNRIRMVNPSGTIRTIAGGGSSGLGDGGPSTAAKLHAPQGVAVDKSGSIYISDESNFRIRKVAGLTSIDELSAAQGLTLFPVPSNGLVSLEMKTPSLVTIEIYDGIGKRIYFEKSLFSKTDIDLTNQTKGIYFYRIFSEAKMVGSGKLIIQ
jgi:sugar lactone lactonase YvrE